MNRLLKTNKVALLIILFCIVTLIKSIWIPEVKATISNGIVATVEDVEKEKTKWTIQLSLKKEDGTPFDEYTQVGGVAYSLIDKGRNSFQYEHHLSEDLKTLKYVLTIQSEGSYPIKGIEIELGDLIRATTGEKMLEENLYDLYKNYPLKYDYKDELKVYNDQHTNFKAVKGLVPLGEIENFSIVGVGFSSNYDREVPEGKEKKELLHIRTQLMYKERGINNEARLTSLYNELTGEEIKWIQGFMNQIELSKGNANSQWDMMQINEGYYEVTNTKKLKSIKPVISYTMREVIYPGKWVLRAK